MQIKHNVHTATNEQKEQVKSLWDYCFQDGAAFTDWFFNNVYKSDNTLVICEESRVVSALQIFYHDLSFCGEKIKAGYIAGVSTYPKFRKRGYASALMETAFSVIYKNGADVAMLIPVNFNFYRKMLTNQQKHGIMYGIAADRGNTNRPSRPNRALR